MTDPKKPRVTAGKPPSACPACGRKTALNFTRPERAGLHCHDENTETWAKFCGVVLCTCGIGYHARGHSNGPMTKLGPRR